MRRNIGLLLRAAAVALAIFSTPVLGCKGDGPAEDTGEKIDEAVDDAKDKVD